MRKNAFTLAELLIALAIISILTGAAMSVFKSYDKGIKRLYSNTYYVLDRALYNSINYWVVENPDAREPFKSQVVNEETGAITSVDINEGTKRLCRALVEYINPLEGDRDSICTTTKSVTDMGNDELFTQGNKQFTATNGIRFWISRRYPDDSAPENQVRYFIIYADLNGIKYPNTMTYEPGTQANGWKTKDPDIFAFAALDTGRICPLGIPEVEDRYMASRVLFQVADPSNDNEMIYRYSEPSRPYVISKAEAWGYYLPADKIPSGSEAIDDDFFIADEPLTYNDYIRTRLSPGNRIYAFLSEGQSMADYVQSNDKFKDAEGNFYTEFKSAHPNYTDGNIYKKNNGGYGCFWKTADECEVIVDKYVD